VDTLYESLSAALLWLLMLPGVLPVFAAAVLVLGLRRARRVRRPIRYRFGVITTAAALVCFSLIPTYAKYVHARRPDEEWFWQALGLVVPFCLLGIGLTAMANAGKTPHGDVWNAL
jgi:hypothetical protein